MRILAALLFCAALLAAACGGDDDTSPTPVASGSPSPTAAGSATETVGPTATATRTGGIEGVLDVPAGGGEVALAAGAYRTARFQPEAHFSLEDGWSAAFDTERFVDLYRGEDPAENCVCLISPDGVFDTESGAKTDLPTDLVTWLTTNPNLTTSNPSSLQVNGLAGRQMDVELKAGVAAAKGTYIAAGDQSFVVKPGEKQHLIVLDYRGKPLIIAQRTPAAEYGAYFPFVESVVGGLTFAG
jgi:hypothetical protein